MTAAPGMAQIHIGCEIRIRLVGFYLYLLLSTKRVNCEVYEKYVNTKTVNTPVNIHFVVCISALAPKKKETFYRSAKYILEVKSFKKHR